MPNAQPEQADGRDGARLSTSGTDARTTATPEQPTLQEFLTRLVGNPEARSAFEADPRGAMESAGLGELNAKQVLQASSLVLDYAPAELVTDYGRTVQPGIDTFAASTQHVAINQLDPAQVPEPQEATDTNMSLLDNDNSASPNYSSGGDADREMEQNNETNVDIDNQDSQNLVNVHDVVSGNDVASGNEVAGNAVGAVGNTVGAVGNTVGGVNNTVDNTVDTVGGTANGAVGEVTDTVDGTVDTGVDVAVGAADTAVGTAGDLPVDDVTSTVEGVAGGATGAEDAAGTLDGATGAVGGTVGQAEDVVGGVTSDLPLDLL
ncbi:hypothetical protein SAMN04487820_106246 [Actinopolyspora mzabensis]|uniref:Uncharacterized protein n=1 Tax=Actinopolyspora mzabensis TaxID=995066 RepID=A0A1G9AV10_ACTMZ|nr:IniB N-terminal domain-containing protein [Actinopolyspora mzabensis]SDK30744.1 hypothetical protein SAMN04487820_106246 [Actinopolyspora mzabensis]